MSRQPTLTLAILAGIAALVASAPAADEELTAQQIDFFEKKIRPILAENCYQCHNSVDKKKGDLALDYKAAILEAGVIVPGDPAASPIIRAIRHDKDYEPMPSKSPKLANVIIKNFEDWIRMGAPDPRLTKPTKAELASQVDWDTVREQRKAWWSFQPVKKSAPPSAADPAWNRSAIDQFIYAGLMAEGLEPQSLASPGTLLRRLHLILTGLPPKPQVVEAFVADPSEAAYEKLVDQLMASPQYGERWARYWMDWFRYAESYGSEGDPDVPYVTQYRDYLVRAINADVAYDQMIREHLAGDLLEKPRVNKELGLNESAIGPAHLRMVPHGFGVTDAYDEQITFTDNQVDVVSKAILGITVSCARCHNHKFDPISQKDFYKFYGIMISSRPAIVNVDSPELQNLHREELAKLKEGIRTGFAAHWWGELDGAIVKLEGAKLDKVPETDPLGAWAKLRGADPETVKRELAAMRQRYQDGLAENEKTKAGATFYADLTDQVTYDNWFKSGNGLGEKVSPAGSFAIAAEGAKALTGIYPAGVYSHLISDKHSGFLTSVFHLADGERNSIRAMGNAGAMARFTLRSYPLSHGGLHPAVNLKPQAGWVNLNKYRYWNGEKGYYQVNTAADTTYRGGGSPRSWFGVFEVYAGNGSMRELGTPIVVLPGRQERITDRDMLLKFYRHSLNRSLTAWNNGRMTDELAEFLNAFVSRGFLTSELDKLPESLRSNVEKYRELEAEIRNPARAPGVVEGEPWDQPLLDRGSYKNEKEPVARGFLEAFPSKPYPKTSSGRRELAEDMLSERNTLTARVIANRLWHHTFGRGLVASADNFGRLGKEPSHPELLDYLAADLRDNGWSMKRTVKQLVMSRTFRSASTAPAANGDKDPANLKLAYYTPRRLDAEAILDTIRFVANNSPGERAIYTRAKRNGLDPFLTTFNYPVPTSTVGVRNLTNVPAQALTLMNGETTKRAANEWSRRVQANPALQTDQQRIDDLFMQAYSRTASDAETAACLSYISGKAVDDSAEPVAQHASLAKQLEAAEKKREAFVAEVRARLQAEVDKRNAASKATAPELVDLKPIGRWDFEGSGKDSIGGMHGTLKGKAKIAGGALVLEGGMMMTTPLKQTLKAKSLEVLVQLDPITQSKGGAMAVQTLDARGFDGIVYAEVEEGVWLSGSDNHKRTDRFQAPPEEDAAKRPVRIVITYQADGTTQAFRDGKPYGKPYRRGSAQFAAGKSQIVFGTRHGVSPSPGRALTGKIFEARLYDRALTADEVAAAVSGTLLEIVTDDMLDAALGAAQKTQLAAHDDHIAKLSADFARLDRELTAHRNAHNAGGDAYFRIAHAILNSKELIYVY